MIQDFKLKTSILIALSFLTLQSCIDETIVSSDSSVSESSAANSKIKIDTKDIIVTAPFGYQCNPNYYIHAFIQWSLAVGPIDVGPVPSYYRNISSGPESSYCDLEKVVSHHGNNDYALNIKRAANISDLQNGFLIENSEEKQEVTVSHRFEENQKRHIVIPYSNILDAGEERFEFVCRKSDCEALIQQESSPGSGDGFVVLVIKEVPYLVINLEGKGNVHESEPANFDSLYRSDLSKLSVCVNTIKTKC